MSKQQDLRATIVANVKEFPTNINAALRLSARQHGATYASAHYQYYGNGIKKSKHRAIRDDIPCFIVQSPQGVMINSKITPIKKETKRTLKLVNTPVSISNMDDAEKLAMIDMIFS